jgi:hypothetical protein
MNALSGLFHILNYRATTLLCKFANAQGVRFTIATVSVPPQFPTC